MKRLLPAAGVVLFAVLVLLPAHSQQPSGDGNQQLPPSDEPQFVIRTETRLVLVPFHVIRKQKYVDDLRAEDIQVLEDGAPQEIAVFEGPLGGPWGEEAGRTVPIELVLLLDVSLSVMNWNLLDGFSLKDTVLDQFGDGVSISIYGFAEDLKRFTGPTRDVEELQRALADAYGYAHLGTRLYEAMVETCRDAANSATDATRVMLILSDSFSTSDALPEDAEVAAKHFGFTLYPLILGHERVVQQAMGTPGGARKGNVPLPGSRAWGGQAPPGTGSGRFGATQQQERESRARWQESRMADFADLGEATGGRSFDPSKVNNLMIRAILKSIVEQVQAKYVAGYYPVSPDGAETEHRVQVKLRKKSVGKLYGGRRLVVH